jgi:hypothetical protein
MTRTIHLLCFAALALGPAACLDESAIYDGGYAGVRPAKGTLPSQNLPQPGKTTPRIDPNDVISHPELGSWSETVVSASGGTTLTVIHEIEANISWLRVFDEEGTELCQLSADHAFITYDLIATSCGLDR